MAPTAPERAARAEPDGYTLLLNHVAQATSATFYRKLAHDPAGAFEGIGRITDVPMTIVARAAEITPLLLGDALEGEAAEVGKVMAGIARSVALHGHPLPPPCVLLSGGETTVTLKGKGRGGRNVEFLLALAVALDGRARGMWGMSGDTDGIDGAGESGGSDRDARYPGPGGRSKGIDARASLADNDGQGSSRPWATRSSPARR